jgi:hypothetical protein
MFYETRVPGRCDSAAWGGTKTSSAKDKTQAGIPGEA